MVARLGFSIAVHTQPEILLVDEVLAVGDLNFAIKCHRKIKEFRDNGGSIVLVSHNAYSIRSNCDRVVWIEHGEVQEIGPTAEVCDAYEAAVARQDATAAVHEFSDGAVTLSALRHPDTIDSGDSFTVELELDVSRPLERPVVQLSFSTLSGEVIVANTTDSDCADVALKVGRNVVQLTYDELPLSRGIYGINVVVADETVNNQLLAVLKKSEFEVRVPQGDLGTGVLRLNPTWRSSDAVDTASLN
jgi:ABC-type glutathione transport system ATPase component